jgi:hypothetical protein
MKKTCLLLAIFNFLFLCISAQDIIIDNNGKKIVCKILKDDSLNVYYSIKQKNNLIDTYIAKTDIKKITYITTLPYKSTSDSVVMRGKYLFYKGQPLRTNELVALLKTNDQSYKKFKSGYFPGSVASILEYVGGGLIGYPIGTAIAGGEPDWTMAAVGGGLIVFSLPIFYIAAKNQREAVNIYNMGVNKTSFRNKELHIGLTNNGLSIRLRF